MTTAPLHAPTDAPAEARPPRRPGLVARSFQRWVQAQDSQAVRASVQNSWIEIGIAVAFICAGAMYVPGVREFFGFRPGPVIAAYSLLFCVSVLLTWVLRGHDRMTPLAWRLLVLGTPAVQLIAAAFAAGAQMPGASIFASLFLFAAGYHGFLHRVTLTEPFIAFGTGCVGVIGALMNPDPAHVALFSVITPAAVSVSLMAGTHAKARDRFRAENERLRAAIDAQVLAQQEQEVRELSKTLSTVLGANHDLRNAVTTATLLADSLASCLVRPQPVEVEVLRGLTSDLQASLQRLHGLVDESRRSSRALTAVPLEPVDVRPVIDVTVQELVRQFPGTELTVSSHVDATRALVRGGEVNLQRMIRNVLQNACEGNGQQAASRVSVILQREGDGLELAVCDNGPGLPRETLAGIQPYATTKELGTGLGLYTTERLVQASDGVLRLANQPEGGARVSIVLPIVKRSESGAISDSSSRS